MLGTFLARRAAVCAVLVFVALAVFSAAAFAAVRTGTDGPETLVGTDRADRITGNGDDDTTVGKDGNDSYFYANGWGKDTLRDSGGRDTLNLSAATTGVWVFMCPEVPEVDGRKVGGQVYERANEAANRTDFLSRIENARTGGGDDVVYGCSGANGSSGGAGDDALADLGGFDLPNLRDLPRSDDRYSGFGPDSGNDFVADAGGRADVLDMRLLRRGDVDLFRIDYAATLAGGRKPDGVADSLLIKIGEESGVAVANYFAPDDYFARYNGRVEKIVFGDKTISPDDAPPLPDPDAQPITASGSVATKSSEGASPGGGLLVDLPE